MKFTSTVISMLFASLAPAVIAQEAPLGGVSILTNFEENYPAEKSCFNRPGGQTIAREISIYAASLEHSIKCTFYSEDKCTGDKATFSAGIHPFRNPFYVASWQCQEA